jgi:signal transduction histidine kinase
MLAGVCLRDTLRVTALLNLSATVPFSAAAAVPLEITASGSDPRSLLIVGVLSGGILFSVVAGALFLRAARTARVAARMARASSERLNREWVSLHAVVGAEPQLLVRWEAGGEPELVASTLDPGLGVPGSVSKALNFADWLDKRSAQGLSERVTGLLDAGEAFMLSVRTSCGTRLEAYGRAAAGNAILKVNEFSAAQTGIEGGSHSCAPDAGRALLDAVPIPVWLRDSDGKLTWVNQAYARAVDAANGAEVCEQQLEFLSTRQRSAAQQSLDQGHTHTGRIHAVVAGERRAFDIVVQPVDSVSAGMAIDVAALETAETELSRHIEEHTRTLDNITTAVAIFSPNQRLQYFNQAFLDLWKLDEAWLATRPTDSEILDHLRRNRCLPEEADYRSWRQKRLDRYEEESTHEERWHLPDGRTIHVVANYDAGGGATYLYDNITEELALKSRFNALIHVQKETLDHLREGVAVFGTDGRLKLFNPAFSSIWKLDPQALEKGPHVDDVIGWCRVLLDDNAAWEEVKRAITGIDDARDPIEGTLTRPDGSALAYAGLPLPDGATLLTYVDITDSKRVENALLERNEALEAADRLKNAFISHVSYELRTPLTNIIGFSELLANPALGELNERQQEYLSDIRASSGDLLTIINDILDLATIDAGALDLSLVPVKASEVIEAAVVGVRERLKQAGVDLNVHVNEDAQDFVADGRRVTQVLFNLLSNAIGFSEPGGTIGIDCRREGEMTAISVEDKGRGIPEDYQESAFDRFETRPQGSQHRGAGLGLTIVKSLVELHGGSVTLKSIPGVGTTVTVRLPVHRESPAAPKDDVAVDDIAPPAAATG